MGTRVASIVGLVVIASVLTTVLAESPPVVDYGKPPPPRCPKNEMYRCQNTCPGDGCINLYAAIDCIANQTCVSDCYCKQGYLRIGRGGPCVPPNQCPPVECASDSNARRGCGDKCGKTCGDYNSNRLCPKRPCKNDGCDCKNGYIHDTNLNKCVLPKDCTKPCKSHERWSPCLAGECVAITCEDLGKPVACPAIANPCPGGCICDYGYVRAKNGTCIDAKNCSSCGDDANAQYGCGNPCGKTCASLGMNKSEIVCPQYCEVNGCDCRDGYLLNTDVKPPKCVLIKNCPNPPEKCGNNEEFYCGPSCPDSEASCSNRNPPTCINKKCELKCFCKKGHVRNTNNLCIPVDACLRTTTVPPTTVTTPAPNRCPKPHEHWTECIDGQCKPKTCAQLITPAPCPRMRPPCPGGCICDDGYLRDVNGNCIKKENCPKTCKGANEEYTDCVNSQCTPITCKDVVKMPACPSPQPKGKPDCRVGCKCKNGFVKSDNGTCIAIKDCPEAGTCTDKNHAWVQCAFICANDYCPKDDAPQPLCFLPVGVCHPGCKCKQNYRIDNKTKQCIAARDCPAVPCTRQNEKYDSCPSRNRVSSCSQLDTTPVKNTDATVCYPGCICKKGYYKNDNNTCVPPYKCPSSQCKKKNERWSNCMLGECRPKTCSDVGFPVACPDIIGPCAGGCICEEGFVKNSKGDCIEMKKCPCCGGDPHAVSGCGNPCGKTCASLYANKSDLICPQYCEYNGCDCKPGYRLPSDDTEDTRKCIPERECPKPPQQCGANEQYYCGTSCPEATCANPTPPTCVNKKCKLACFCKKGYVRDSNNKCVPVDKCPKQCKGAHEKYIDCPAGQCTPKTCDDLMTPPGCPRIKPPCPGGCVCEAGYLRDKNGKCIPQSQCPSAQCKKKNERWSNCMLGECRPKTCGDVGFPVACPDIIGPCAGGCICEEGFVKNSKGDCIEMKKCPCCGGDPHAVSGCGNPCGKTCASLYANKSDLICPQYCEYNGCDCKPGYRLPSDDTEDTRKCIPERECPKPPQQCGANEQYYCGTSCPEATCANRTPPTCVNKKCKLACFCKKGYVRDSNNKCVPVNKCPKPSCKANEIYAPCGVKCPDKYCPKVDGPQPVCDPPRNCPPGCVCKVNYRYDDSGKCIPASECPKLNCTRNNTEWNSCPSACLSEQCADADSQPVTCNTLLLNCNPRCVCKPGHFVHPDTGDCVPAKECPNVCKDPNASWKDCRDACPATCQNTKPNCVNKRCSPGCQCNEGYVLSKEGPDQKCVKIESCPDYADCPANQTFVSCTFRCPQVMCPKSDQTILCKPPRDCPGGCGCKPYYRYNADDDCVKASDCPPVECTRPHEEFKCKHEGDWEYCHERYNSPPSWAGHPDDCEPKCTCVNGYYKNPAGNCVLPDECPPIDE